MTLISYKPEVQTDATGKWYDNKLRFATREEAQSSGRELMSRWFLVRGFRASPSEDPVNYRHVNGRDVRIDDLPS